jgi:hypothetical protein
MIWNLIVAGRIVAWLVVSEDVIDWLRPQLTDLRAKAIDEPDFKQAR